MSPKPSQFEMEVMPHLDAAFNLARWLMGNEPDACDVVQEAMLRALKYFTGFRGEQPRAWLLKVVRNTAYSWLKSNRKPGQEILSEDSLGESDAQIAAEGGDPEVALLQKADAEAVQCALQTLAAEFREILVLREFENLSYREIAEVTNLSIGTVMSRLSRSRAHLKKALSSSGRQGVQR